MSDDTGRAPADPVEGGDPTDPWTPPVAGGAPSPPPPPPPPPLPPPASSPSPATGTPSAAVAPPAAYYPDPTDPTVERFWDGTAWTAVWRRTPDRRPDYWTRYRRRWGWSVLGWSVLASAVFALRRDVYPGTAVQGQQAAFLIGGLVGLLIAGSAVALLVAIPRGGAPGGTPTPLWRFPAVGAVTGAVLLAVVLGWWTGRAPETRTFVIGSPADGCRSFTALLLGAVKDHESDAAMRADVTALRDAAQIHDPDLATDLEPLVADLSDPALAGAVQADSQTAAKNIYGRCLKEGWMTPQEVTAVGDQLNSLLGR